MLQQHSGWQKKHALPKPMQVVYHLRASLATPWTRRRWTDPRDTYAKFFSSKKWTHRHRSHLKIYFRMMRGGFPKVTTTTATTTADPTQAEIFSQNENNDGATMIKRSRTTTNLFISTSAIHVFDAHMSIGVRDPPADCGRASVCADVTKQRKRKK